MMKGYFDVDIVEKQIILNKKTNEQLSIAVHNASYFNFGDITIKRSAMEKIESSNT